MSAVLVVCEQARVRRFLASALRQGGFDPKVVRDASDAGRVLRRGRFGALVLGEIAETNVPGVVADLRARTEIPILVACERGETWDVVDALNAGSDDVLILPFAVDELVARVRATLRLFERAVSEPPVETDDFVADVSDRRLVRADGSEPQLTSTEWRILEVLFRHAGRLVSQEELLRSVWGPDAIDKGQYVRVHLASIRRKIEPVPSQPKYFVTVPGLGLRFVPSQTAARGSAS